LTPGRKPRKRRPSRARERPLRANGPVLERPKAAARLKALKRKPDTPVAGELTDEAHGALKRGAQYRACR